MPLRILHGRFHPELEEAFAAELAALKRRRPLAPVTVVAPSQRLARHLAAVAAAAFPDGLAAVRFHNLFSFARALDDEIPLPGTRFVDDDVVLERLVVEIVRREFGDRPHLRRALAIPGTARALLGALRELRDAAVDPADALNAMTEEHLGAGEDSPKLAELLSLHYLYAKELRDRGWRDRADVVLRAAELAPRSKLLAAQQGILYYGFYELVQTQLDLFNRVSRSFPTVAFYPYADRPEYAFCREFFASSITGEKRALQPGLFAGAPRRRVLSASGARDEVWAAAKEILRLRDEGVAFDGIAVVARTLDPYADTIESVFRENRIPFSSSARVADPPDRAIRLLSVGDAGFPRDLVMSLLEGPDVPLWDLATRALGIGRTRAEWERRLTPGEYAPEESRSRLRVPAATMAALCAAVRDLIARTSGPDLGTWAEHAAWARALVGKRDEIDSLAALDGVAPPPDGREFRRLLCDRLRRATRPAGADDGRGVQVLDAMAARGLRFDAVVLLGLNERVWPRFILEDPFVPDAVRAQLTFRLGSRMPQKLAGYDEERLLFATAAGAARDELVVLWQRSDDKGRAQVRSPFVEEDGIPVPRRPAGKLLEWAPELLTPKEASVRALLSGPRAEGRGEAAARAFGWDADAFAASMQFLRALEDDRVAGPRDGVVGRIDEWWTPTAARGLSPTALERFAQCPFLYFSGKVLGLEELDEPEWELEFTPMETGSLYHAFLERFYRSLAGRPLPASLDEARGAFDAGFAATAGEFEATRTMRFPILWEAERRRMRSTLELFVAHDLARRDGFVPAHFEEKLEGTLDLPLGRHGGVNFIGYADRVDLHPSGAFRVIDYKSGRGTRYPWRMDRGVFGFGRYLQPPIYFLLAEKALRSRGGAPKPAESSSGYAFLRELAEGREPEIWLRGAFWEQRESFARILQRYLEAISEGIFAIKEGPYCSYCEMSSVCRRRHQPTRWRARRAAFQPAEAGR